MRVHHVAVPAEPARRPQKGAEPGGQRGGPRRGRVHAARRVRRGSGHDRGDVGPAVLQRDVQVVEVAVQPAGNVVEPLHADQEWTARDAGADRSGTLPRRGRQSLEARHAGLAPDASTAAAVGAGTKARPAPSNQPSSSHGSQATP